METEIMLCAMFGIMSVAGFFLYDKSKHLISNGEVAKGIVFKNNFRRNGGDGKYYPVIRFTTKNKDWITQELSIGYMPALEKGSEVEVLYDPANPTDILLNNKFQLFLLPKLLAGIGILGFLVSFLFYIEIL